VPTPFEPQAFATLLARGVLQIGDGHRAKLSELDGDGPIFLRAGLLSDDGIRLQGADHFRKDVAIPSSKFSVARDTFVTTKGNSVGRTGYIATELPTLVYSPHLSYWRSLDPDTLHPEFLRYWAQSPDFISQLHTMAHGTDMAPYLSLIDQRRLVIPLPLIEEQRAIAGILGALDDKIANNRRIVATLEALARTLIDSTAQLSNLVSLAEVATVNESRVRRRQDGTLRYVDIGGVDRGDVTSVEMEWSHAPSRAQRGVRDGDTVLSMVRPERGAFFYAVAPSDDLVVSSGFAVVHPTSRSLSPLLYCWLTSPYQLERYGRIADGGAYPAMRAESLLKIEVPLQASGAAEAGRFLTTAAHQRRESQLLAELRDALIPQLVSGSLRVGEDSAAAEGAD
jgi:type I restriction enzyme S subunit